MKWTINYIQNLYTHSILFTTKKAKTMINLSRSFSKKIKMPQQMVVSEDNNNF